MGTINVPWWIYVLIVQKAKPTDLTGIHRGDLEGNTDHPLQVREGDQGAQDGPHADGLPLPSMDQLHNRHNVT